MRVEDIARITLYHTGCIGCDRQNKYGPLHKFILHNSLPLSILTYKRIELNPKWREEAKDITEFIKAELPVLSLTHKYFENESRIISYTDFIKEYCEKKVAKRHTPITPDGAKSNSLLDGSLSPKKKAPRTSDGNTNSPDAVPKRKKK